MSTRDDPTPPDSSESPAAPDGAVRHRAPPPDRRPRSRLATWALLVAFGASGAAFALNLLWPLAVPAFVFCVWAALRINPREERGQGFVFVSILITLLVGGFAFVGTMTMLDMTAHMGDGVLTSASVEGTPEERLERVRKWFTKDAAESGAGERLLQRFDAAVAAVGTYGKDVVRPSFWLGLNGVRVVPKGAKEREIAPGVGDPWAPHRDAVWTRAKFRDGEIWVELVLGDTPLEEQTREVEALRKGQASRLLADVRLFRVD